MDTEILARGFFSFVSGVSLAITGFGCDSTSRELFAALLTGDSKAFLPPSAINMGLSAALVTAVQAVLQRRLINGELLVNTLPLTFVGVVLSLNVFPAPVLVALVPVLGASLLGVSLTKLWMELVDCGNKVSVRNADDDGRQRAHSWQWTGMLAAASLTGGLLSGRCPAPGPALMMVLLASRKEAPVNGGDWRATAALLTFSSSMLRVGLLLLENGASAGPLPEVSVLVLGGLLGLGAGNLSLRLLFSHDIADAEKRRTPSAAAFRRSVLAVALMSSTAMAFGGPPAALTDVARPLVLGVFAVICAVALGGCCWGLFGGAGRSGVGARQAYGTVASDDHEVEVELKPFAADDGPDGRAEDDDYLDEEDGYLADEGEIEVSSRRGGKGQPVRGSRVIRSSLTAPHSLPAGGSREKTVEGKREKKVRWEAPPAHSLFPEGHTMEL